MDWKACKLFTLSTRIQNHFKKQTSLLIYFGLISTLSPLANANQPSCSASIVNNWNSGSQVSITVKNPGTAMLQDWHVEISYPNNGTVVQSWSSTREGNNPALFSGPSWKVSLNPSEQFIFGFIASHNAGFETPEITACYSGAEPVEDNDGDGVSDDLDFCPNTPSTDIVDTNGCGQTQLDDDNDGVMNAGDACPNTPSSDPADTSGCGTTQLDDDNDGVMNAGDACPNTPSTDTADTNGCGATQLDDDSDGVMNAGDACPNTPSTDSADTSGCGATQLDDDNDGVMNAGDACPDTPSTDTADTSGCGQTQLDDDKDGVMNAGDACPNTPSTDSADTNGCGATQLDDDNDGVMNAGDACPNTPSTDSADTNGCGATQLDDDNDGVMNAGDACPNTPSTDSADTSGCGATQLDDDNDGVMNAGDACPNTPSTDSADTNGCGQTQLDDDNDGVMNAGDACPNTPSTDTADTNGCGATQLDDDNDGVMNAGDACPNTPSTDSADTSGCGATQLDDDNDGVMNASDACPNTPSTDSADTNGCGATQLDDDNDGVMNAGDACPNTPSTDSADTSGCGATQLDDDNDGVMNADDLCPDTPANETITGPSGCSFGQMDDDQDSVQNSDDVCPNTDWGDPVDSAGCSWKQLDDDSDGVNNHLDVCPDTLGGNTVDEFGCAANQRDTDYDGILDDEDLCPDNSTGPVTEYGCDYAGDEDGDFITNDFDLCPFSQGLAILNGCKPSFGDFDSDGVSDDIDECPYTLSQEAIRPIHIRPADQDELSENGCSILDLDFVDADQIPWGKDMCTLQNLYDPNNSYDEFGCGEQALQDDDGDGVINGLDLCPGQFGYPRLNGCSDQGDSVDIDSDGIINQVDVCPFSPLGNNISINGCSHFDTDGKSPEDRDLDGIIDNVDLCLNSPMGHVVDGEGCTLMQRKKITDSDGDGVVDLWDLCPFEFFEDERHSTAFGCDINAFHVDGDHDGIPDSHDTCPADAGLLIHSGCPSIHTALSTSMSTSNPFVPYYEGYEDKDLDFTPDTFDLCPYSRVIFNPEDPNNHMAPPIPEEGCFTSDRLDDDYDGVINGLDLCPRTTSTAFLDVQGCNDIERLDFDGDGVINGADLCPYQPGYWKLNGCFLDPMDADLDGVMNDADRCPLSPSSSSGPLWPTDPDTGCSTETMFDDSDGDGIINNEDNCPNTPFGDYVHNYQTADDSSLHGCSYQQKFMDDEDGDLVEDIHDQCPNTPPGEFVDQSGCSDPFGDEDGDTIVNQDDQCPGTLLGLPVLNNGCSSVKLLTLQAPIYLTVSTPTAPEMMPGEVNFNLLESNVLKFDGDAFNDAISIELEAFAWNGELSYFIDETAQQILFEVNPNFPAREIHIRMRVFSHGLNQFSNWSEIILTPASLSNDTPLGSLIINDPQVLMDADIRLFEIFALLADGPDNGVELFKQFWASQKSMQINDSPFICTPDSNNFPLICDRPETDVAFMDNFQAEMEMNLYQLTAVVNRIDLRQPDWQDCGEQRLVFAIPGDPRGRMFLNFEARLPNPEPGIASGCATVIQFWRDLPNLPPFEQGFRIKEMFVLGNGQPYTPIMLPEHFTQQTGQIRSNQFMGGEWLLKEHKLLSTCDTFRCGYFVESDKVNSSPFAPLFNPDLPFGPSPWAMLAADFQDEFAFSLLDGLASTDFGALRLDNSEQFNQMQSISAGPDSNDSNYLLEFNSATGPSPFTDQLMDRLWESTNADGSPLMPEQVVARASALSCAGCHNPTEMGLTQPGVIGSLQLPDGSIIDSWPNSLDFVHIDEQGNLSPAMQEVFLPVRQKDFSNVIEQLNF